VPAIRTRPEEPGPKNTLGDQLIVWAMRNLVHAVTGEPWVPLPEHSHFINTWYQVEPDGSWTYSQGYLRRARGTAKSPLAAILSAMELCGPCRFGGWDLDGFPIAIPEPSPWCQIMATSMAQTRPIFDIVANSFSAAAIAEYGLEFGKEMITKSVGPRGRLEVIPNNPRALRGARPTFTAVDETSELVAGNSGHESLTRIDGNLDKNPGGRARRLDLSNAFVPGEDSVAERVTMAWSSQVAKWGYSYILFDNLEADPSLSLTDEGELRQAIEQAAGDATWLDTDRLVRTAKNPQKSVSVFRREHLNQIASAEDSLVSGQAYDRRSVAIEVPALVKGDEVTLGFDGSLSGDGTALVAFRLSDRSFHLLHYQEPDPLEADWKVDEQAVDDAYRAAMDKYKVPGSACDVHPFESWVLAWNRDFGDQMKVSASTAGAVIRDNRSARRDLTLGCESMVGEVNSGKLSFSQGLLMRSHWLNAKKAENRYGISFRKETPNSTRRVDIVAACLMSYLIATKLDALAVEVVKPRRGSALGW
jgi:hypothetical protein